MKTVRDWDEAHRTKVYGAGVGPSLIDTRAERALGIVIDGQPLGDHLLPPDSSPTINEDVKKVNERIVVAKLLVAADLDGQLESLTSLKERPQPTADFDAMLHDGQLVKIEVSSLADPSEKQSNSTLNKTLWGLSAQLASCALRVSGGPVPEPEETRRFGNGRRYCDACSDCKAIVATIRSRRQASNA